MSNDSRDEVRRWAYEEFGHADLGDARRTTRLVRMATAAALRPGDTVLDVFLSSAERQTDYDFLANPDIRQEDLLTSVAVATASRCESHPFVFVAVDGTSLTLTDRARTRDFRAIGSNANVASGVEVVHDYAVSPAGVPLGILGQQWWSRTRQEKRNDCHDRPVHEPEADPPRRAAPRGHVRRQHRGPGVACAAPDVVDARDDPAFVAGAASCAPHVMMW
ncbi:hypothetical protein SCE1572_16075 [Sorangium cellulosum So0157-2]|uniref:Transposase Tn5-like N-terminal domain-containing protein n=1 Tax=Sorangium cellulosum So0157-2 TaxID=1254432 RepID=S4XTM8_SORCE|nr:hypothetical protein SCE1572_16075 [Sorangium cellulosum So0157-2]